jgi:hypothetical protein
MFNFFGSKDQGVKVNDKVWISSEAKLNACKKMAAANPQAIFVCWFDETLMMLKSELPPDSLLLMARDLQSANIGDRMIIFAEHHPSTSVEQQVFLALGLTAVPVLSALDEPFFENFGGTGTIEMMRKLGMDENEALGHGMISKAIRNAQKKLAEKMKSDLPASSQREWIQRNL